MSVPKTPQNSKSSILMSIKSLIHFRPYNEPKPKPTSKKNKNQKLHHPQGIKNIWTPKKMIHPQILHIWPL